MELTGSRAASIKKIGNMENRKSLYKQIEVLIQTSKNCWKKYWGKGNWWCQSILTYWKSSLIAGLEA
jgi:hypothetical protein